MAESKIKKMDDEFNKENLKKSLKRGGLLFLTLIFYAIGAVLLMAKAYMFLGVILILAGIASMVYSIRESVKDEQKGETAVIFKVLNIGIKVILVIVGIAILIFNII